MPIRITHSDYVITIKRQSQVTGWCISVFQDLDMEDMVACELGFATVLEALTWLSNQPFITGHRG